MSRPGMGVMLKEICGCDHGGEDLGRAVGKRITGIGISDDDVTFDFEDGSRLRVTDEGQSCCEHRYMTTDDDLGHFVGSSLIEMHIQDGPEEEHDYEVHETQFLIVKTSAGEFTVVTHNEHNGYYGGFWLKCRHREPEAE